MKYKWITVLLILSLLTNGWLIVKLSSTVEEEQIINQMNSMLNESAQLIMYDMSDEQIIQLDQTLNLTMTSAHAFRDDSKYAAEVWRQSLVMIEHFFMQVNDKDLIEELNGEKRQEIALIIMDAVEKGDIERIEENITGLISDDHQMQD